MAKLVREVMNPELFHVRPDEGAESAAAHLLALDVTAAPVLDELKRPLGVVSLRDCLRAPADSNVSERMSRPAVTIGAEATIEGAARLLVDAALRHLVVVDTKGRAVGMVSAADLLAAIIGAPVRHPTAFPHFDQASGLSWTDDTPLAMERVEAAPGGPGILLLVVSNPGMTDRIAWAEWTPDMRSRLIDYLTLPQPSTQLVRLLRAGTLRFRAASVASEPEARRILDEVIAAPHPLH